MLLFILILWVLVWGAAGYFTVRAIRARIEKKRMERYLMGQYQMRHARKNADGEIAYDLAPLFVDLIKR